MSSSDDDFRQLLQTMIQSRTSEIERLLKLREAGVTVGAPSIDDIINREHGAIDYLQKSLDWFNTMRG